MTTKKPLILAAISLLALSTLAWAILDYRAEEASRAERAAVFTDSGVGEVAPRLVSVLQSDPDGIESDSRLALAMVALTLDPKSRAQASTPEAARAILAEQIRGLDRAEEVANRSLALRPGSWRALTALGASTYLRWSFAKDDRLIRDYKDWEAPLLAAREIAPERSEPLRFLSMAYLEMWPILSPEKRELTRSMLRKGLNDQGAYLAIIDAWLRAATNSREAIELLPDQAWVHKDLRVRMLAHDQPSLAAEADRRFRIRIQEEAEEKLLLAVEQSSRGDFITARKTAFQALDGLPVVQQYAPIFERTIRVVPAGPIPPFIGGWSQWLDFNATQCLRRECPLARDVVERLLPTASGVRRMRVELALGNLSAAQALEANLDKRCIGQSAAYWQQKAGLQIRLGDLGGARRSLVACKRPSPERSDFYLHQRLVQAASSLQVAEEAEQSFGNSEERFLGRFQSRGFAEFSLPRGNYELEVTAAVAPDQQSLVEFLVDGATAATTGITADPTGERDRHVRLSIAASGGPQMLQARSLAGPRLEWRISGARLIATP